MLNKVKHFLWETNNFYVISNGEFLWLHGKEVPSLKYLEGSFCPPCTFHSLPSKELGKGPEQIHLPQSSPHCKTCLPIGSLHFPFPSSMQ